VDVDEIRRVYYQAYMDSEHVLHPKMYNGIPNGYASHKYACHTLGMNLLLTTRKHMDLPSDYVREITAGIAAAIIRDKTPIYWIGKELFTAIKSIDLPKDLTVGDIPWLLPSGIFMLPDKLCGQEIPFIAFRVHKENDIVVHDNVQFRGCDGKPGFSLSYQNDTTGAQMCQSSSYLETCENIGLDQALNKVGLDADGRECYINPETGDIDEIRAATAFIMNLFLLADHLPDILESNRIDKVVKSKCKTFNKVFWNAPIWGKEFRIKTEAHGGTHASPRLHLRRGHWRTQHHGPKNSLHKRILIPPMWINAT